MAELKEVKMLQAMVDVTNYLAEHEFTYEEAEEFVYNLQSEISYSKDAEEYETAEDWYNKNPRCDVLHKVLVPLKNINIKELFS